MKKILILALLCVGIYWCFKSCIGCKSGDSSVGDSGKLVENEITEKYYSDYKEACKDGAFEDAHEKLEKIHESFVSYSIRWSDYLQEAREYFSALEYIYKAEIQYIVANLDDEACKDKITFILTEIPIDGQKPDKSFNIIYYDFREGGRFEKDHTKPYKVYGYYVTSYNHLLDHALTLAINRKYKKLAESILLLYIDDLEFEVRKDNDSSLDYYYAKYSRTSYKAAKDKYDRAVSMQLFE
jgi:hypothetical protein